ncbi:MAG: hypothetical protein EA411_12130 [Saprospirales bacterium]|nr:MAG: hypothetical protein EA411_12130 [Saprospirales bacterium]
MNINSTVALATVMTMLFLTGCFQDEDIFVPDGNFEYAGNIQKLKSDLKPSYIGISVIFLEEEQVLKIDDETSLIVKPDNFIDATGEFVNDNLKLFFLITRNPSDWIAAGHSFMGEKSLLDVFAANKLIVRDSLGNELSVNPDNPPVLRLEYHNIQAMERSIFIRDGESDLATWLSVPDAEIETLIWYEDNEDGEEVRKEGVEFPVNQTGWHALAEEIDLDLEVMACASLPDGYSSNNTVLYVIMSNYQSVVRLNSWSKNNDICNPQFLLPRDQAAEIVSISSFTGNRYFFAMNQVVLDQSENHTNLNPIKRGLSHIQEQINNRN